MNLRKIENSIIEMDTPDQEMMNQYFTSSIGDNKVNVEVKFAFKNIDFNEDDYQLLKII